jgi:hypothetical protein
MEVAMRLTNREWVEEVIIEPIPALINGQPRHSAIGSAL